MKYIQCPHCKKKYAASEKLSAAVGKKIRCKHCQQVFEIIISDDGISKDRQDIPSPPDKKNNTTDTEKPLETASANKSVSNNENPEEEVPHDSGNDEPEEKASPAKKKYKLQLFISIFLGIALLATITGAYLFLYHNELFHPSPQQDKKHIIPQQLVKPINITFAKHQQTTEPKKTAPEPTKHKPVQPAPHISKPKSLLDGPYHPSQVCKDSSAEYWFRTRIIASSKLDTTTYLELVSQNMDQANEIRRLCKDKSLLGRITESAKSGQIPPWIKTEVTSRNQSVTEQQTTVE